MESVNSQRMINADRLTHRAFVAGMFFKGLDGSLELLGAAARVCTRQRQRVLTAGARGPGDHHPLDAMLARTLQHRIEVMPEGFVGEVGADVDQVHRSSLRPVRRSSVAA